MLAHSYSWFDAVATQTLGVAQCRDPSAQVINNAPAGSPSVYVRAVITWIAIFPLVTLGFFVIAPFASDWNPVLRAFVLSIVVVPVAVYLVVPQLMRANKSLGGARR